MNAPASPLATDASARTGRHVAFLDGLRGFAVMIVFMSHASAKEMALFGFSLDGTGKSGVFLFFVLSSYLITAILLRGGANLWTRDYLVKFFGRRFLRVYPLFAVYVLCALITTPMALAIFGTTEFAAPFPLDFAGAVQHWVLLRGDGVSWSIPVEMKFYFVSPFLAAALMLLHRKLGLAATVALALLGALGVIALGNANEAIDPAGSDTAQLLPYLAAFMTGATLALAISRRDAETVARPLRIAMRLAGWLALLAVFLATPSVYFGLVGEPVDLKHFHSFVLTFSLLWSLVLAACWAGDPVLCRIFTWRPLRFLGMISFSFYLSHPIVQELSSLAIARYSPLAAFVVALAGTTLVSWASFRLFEKPILDRGTDKVNGWLRERAVARNA